MNTTLLIMAAGIGSRFGTGIKQLEPVNTPGSDPIKKKINISKEIINKTRGAEAPYAAQIFTHLSVLISHLRGQAPLTKCEQKFE